MVAADLSAESGNTRPVSVWDQLREAADVVLYRPKLREGLVWRELTSAHGEAYVIVQSPQAATYLRLAPEEFFVFNLMDGSHSIQDLVVAYMLKFRKFALPRVGRLVQELRYNHFLVDAPYFTFQQLRRRARRRTIGTFLDDYLKVFFNREFPITGIDTILERAYRAGIWLLFTRPVSLLLALISAVGVPLFIYYLLSRQFPLFPGASITQDLVGYYVSFTIVAVTHELAHAFTVKSYGRVVRRGGASFFYGFPGLFVDTQDIWMEPRRPRMAASWAGPYSGLIYAGLVGLVLTFTPEGAWSAPLRLFGSVALVANLFQLMPLIQLDGYFILMDWLEMPQLRKRALAFVRHDLWAKLRRRQRFNREERIFAIFGVLAAVYTVYAISLAGSFWWNHASEAIQTALRVPNLASLLGLTLVLLLIVPFGLALAHRAFSLGQGLFRASRRATGLARERWYRERAALVMQVPALASLGREQTQALASHFREERFSAGVAVVRQGDHGDRFYLIADGRAAVSVEDANRSELVRSLGALDYFGERALLSDEVRTATVRAETKLRLLSLSATDFRRSLAPYVGADAALRLRMDERTEIDQFPLFEPLGPREKDVLLARFRRAAYEPGRVVVHEGDTHGDFYCIRSGHVEVTRRDQHGREFRMATMGPTEFFGEVALLLDTSRNATIRALDEAQLWVLSYRDFHDLLGRYFNLELALADVARARLPSTQVMLDLSPASGANAVAAGSMAPDFSAESVDGGMRRLADFRHGQVLVWFSPGFSVRACAEYAERLDAALPAFRARGIQVVQIVPDPADRTRGYRALATVSHPVLCDPAKRVYVQYELSVEVPGPPSPAGPSARSATDDIPGSWMQALGKMASDQPSASNVGVIQEGIFLIDADGVIRIRLMAVPSTPLPAPEELLVAATTSPA